MPVRTVNADHQIIRRASTRRGPYRSPSVPPTICSRPYVYAKAEKIRPIVVFEKPNSWMIFGAVTEIVTRSR